jgi:hypothetical protein
MVPICQLYLPQSLNFYIQRRESLESRTLATCNLSGSFLSHLGSRPTFGRHGVSIIRFDFGVEATEGVPWMMRMTALDVSHPLPVKLPPAPSNLYRPAQSACRWRRLELPGVHKYRATQICTAASNTLWALSIELTSCHPSTAQNIETALWFLKKIVCPGLHRTFV